MPPKKFEKKRSAPARTPNIKSISWIEGLLGPYVIQIIIAFLFLIVLVFLAFAQDESFKNLLTNLAWAFGGGLVGRYSKLPKKNKVIK